jgi:hypothetical protein
LAPTNQWEVVRFRAKGAVHIVYRRANGQVSIKDAVTAEALEAWQRGAGWNPGLTKKARTNLQRTKAALLHRDGDLCWFCGEPMGDDITVEHLVARGKGGPDHQDNLVLGHDRCNKAAGNLPLKEKIDIHVRARLRKAGLGGCS